MVLPLRAVLFQLLFLLVAIAIEGRTLHQQLRLSLRASVEYAIVLNLVTILLGWSIFFGLENILPPILKNLLINFVLFQKVTLESNLWLLCIGFLLFVITLFIKIKSVEFIDTLNRSNLPKPFYFDDSKTSFKKIGTTHFLSGATAEALLRAQSYSHIAILILLIINFILA